MTIKVKAAGKILNAFGGWYQKGDTIKEINPDNVKRIVSDGRCGDITFYYRNGLHEVYNQSAVVVEIDMKGEQA